MDDTSESEDHETMDDSFPVVQSLWEFPNVCSSLSGVDSVVLAHAIHKNDDKKGSEEQPWVYMACKQGTIFNVFSYPVNQANGASLDRLPRRCHILFDFKVEAIALAVESDKEINHERTTLVACTRDGKLWKSAPNWNKDHKNSVRAMDCMVACQTQCRLLGTKRLTTCTEHPDSSSPNGILFVATGTMLRPPQVLHVPNTDCNKDNAAVRPEDKPSVIVETFDLPGLEHVDVMVTSVLFLSCRLLSLQLGVHVDSIMVGTGKQQGLSCWVLRMVPCFGRVWY